MRTCTSTINDVNITTIVDIHVVGLDLHGAVRVVVATNLLSLIRFLRNEVADFTWAKWVANIDGAHAGIEVREQHNALVKVRVVNILHSVHAESTASMTKITGLLRHLEVRDRKRMGLVGDVYEKRDIALRLACLVKLLRDNDEQVDSVVLRIVGVVGNLDTQNGLRRVRAVIARHVEPCDLRVKQVVSCRRQRIGNAGVAVHQFVTIQNLNDTVSAWAVTHVDAITVSERLVQTRRFAARRPRLPAIEREVADVLRLLGITEIVKLQRSGSEPTFSRAVQIRNTGFTFPLNLVGLPLAARRIAGAIDRQQEFWV